MKHGDQVLLERAAKLQSVRQLNPTALGVIGLWHMGVTGEAEIARILACTDRRVGRLLRIIDTLKTSKHPLVREWVDHALPPGVYATLNYEILVWCPLCHNTVNRVPCPYCSVRGQK